MGIDSHHQVGLLLVLILYTTNLTKYGCLDSSAIHWPFVLRLGCFNPITYCFLVIGLGLLLILVVVVTFNDVLRLIRG